MIELYQKLIEITRDLINNSQGQERVYFEDTLQLYENRLVELKEETWPPACRVCLDDGIEQDATTTRLLSSLGDPRTTETNLCEICAKQFDASQENNQLSFQRF